MIWIYLIHGSPILNRWTTSLANWLSHGVFLAMKLHDTYNAWIDPWMEFWSSTTLPKQIQKLTCINGGLRTEDSVNPSKIMFPSHQVYPTKDGSCAALWLSLRYGPAPSVPWCPICFQIVPPFANCKGIDFVSKSILVLPSNAWPTPPANTAKVNCIIRWFKRWVSYLQLLIAYNQIFLWFMI